MSLSVSSPFTLLPGNDLTATREHRVTAPLTPGPSLTPSPTPTSSPAVAPATPVDFPLGWLLQTAAPPLKYRALMEVARQRPPDVVHLYVVALSYPPALTLALTQRADGTWSEAMLSVPSARAELFQGVGTIYAVRRLLEYGWEPGAPPLLHARRTLFRLLAEDEDPAFLYEFAPPRGKADPEVTRHGRTVLREAAAAALAQAGYENDPRLRGAARRIVERLDTFLKSPLAQKPFIRAGNQHVLAPGAAPPSIHTLVMLAHMPLFRSEHYDVMDRLYHYLTQPLPRAAAASLVAKKVVPQPHLVLGDPLPHRSAADADVPWALTWLELMARLHFLRRNEGWTRLFERFLDERDDDGVWRKNAGALRTSNPFVWPSYPLEAQPTGEERWTDVTFRLGLIARIAGRPINAV